MGNQGSSELDSTIDKIIDLKNKPGLLKVELNKFVQQVPLEHSFEMKVDKKLFDILMNLITYELKQPGSPDIHIIMMTIQRLLKVKGFYMAIPKCSILPLIAALQHKDPTVVMSSLNALAWLLDCHVVTQDKKFEKAFQETAAKQAFCESKGYEVLINRVLIYFSKIQKDGVVAKVVDILALDLVDNCVTTRFIGIQKLLTLLSPHMDLLLALTSHPNLMTRCYGSILLQGFLLHSSLSVTQNLQSKVLEEGHLLWYILFAVDGANLPAGHPYKDTLYDKNLTELSRNLLGLLCAGNATIVEISVQKTIPKPLQVSLESLNADSKTNTSLSARSKQEKETIKNTLWNNFQSGRMKRVNIHPQFQRLDQETREPHILWTVGTKAELCTGLMKEIDDLRLQKESRENVRWDYDGWEISYKSLNRYLRVGGFYISLLLPVLQDKNSSYVIEIDRIHMLLAGLFQRSVVEDDPGWKLACLRTMSALYEKYGDQLTKDLEILPYFAWLIDPKHTLPIYRDHILRMLQTLLKDASNVKRFVRSGGVSHLLYYISRVLTLPDTPAPGEKKAKSKVAIKKKRKEESDDEEEEEEESKESGEKAANGENPVGGSEEDSDSQKQNLLVGLPHPLGVAETATLCLSLLRLIQLAGPKMKRVMSEKDVINTLVRLLMSPIAGVKEDGIRLLLEILDHSTHLVPKLVTTGLFSFLVYGLRNGLSPATLELISKYHMKQDKSVVPVGESALTPYFPRALSDVLKNQGTDAFSTLFETKSETGSNGSELIWNPGLKKHLFEVMTRRLGTFRQLLVNDPFAEYKFSPPDPIRYPSLESELCMAGVFLRQLNETGGVPALMQQVSIPNPDELMGELIQSLNARKYAGIDLLNILTAQVIMIKTHPDLHEVQSYPGWEALFEILNNHGQESDFPMIEKSAEIIHVLLSQQTQHPDDDENLHAFVEAKGITLLAKTLEYFASLKVNNILIQRILIALLHCVYDIAWKQPELVAKEFGSNKKFLRKNILEFLGRKVTQEHPMLTVVTCKTLMALSLNDRFQTILLETGTLLHLVDMAVFYRSIASEQQGSAANAKGMDEEKRVRLAASSVISVLAGFTTPAIHPEPNQQVQRILSALLTPDLTKSLQNPSGFVQRCTENRPALLPLYKFIETELLSIAKAGEWPQKQWPFQPFFSLTKPRQGSQLQQRGSTSSYRSQQDDEQGQDDYNPDETGGDDQGQGGEYDDQNGDGQGGQEYDENGEPIAQEELPDAYSSLAPTRRVLSPSEKVAQKMENLGDDLSDKMSGMTASIGGAFDRFKNKAKNMVSPAKVEQAKADAAAAAAKAKAQAQATGRAIASNEQVKRATSTASSAVNQARQAAAPTINAARQAAAPTIAAGRQAASDLGAEATVAAKKLAIDAQPMIQKGQAQAAQTAAQVRSAATKGAQAAEPKLNAAKASLSAFGAAAAGAAAGAFASAKAATAKKQPSVVTQPPPAQYSDDDDAEVETMDSSSFYGQPEPDLASPSTQHTPYGASSSGLENSSAEPTQPESTYDDSAPQEYTEDYDQNTTQGSQDPYPASDNGHYDVNGGDSGEHYEDNTQYSNPDQNGLTYDDDEQNGMDHQQHDQYQDEENVQP